MFATSEVRLGLAPSTISPYVIRAIGARQASRYFLTAERLSAQQAKAIGLAHEVYSAEALDTGIQQIIEQLLLGSPQAQTASKQLIDTVAEQELTPELMQQTATHIARLRLGEEAQEGLSAFLEKRTPHWCA
jgi:methylglutaconyl-CoA hydratase